MYTNLDDFSLDLNMLLGVYDDKRIKFKTSEELRSSLAASNVKAIDEYLNKAQTALEEAVSVIDDLEAGLEVS
ncbi:hypothetical protein AYP76_07360 [Ligilactobacillus agilis]|uniref:hypothetical protein n=1 Tax=Ligilactobacillus agilis TaxID=1601 RepID=UPI000B5DAEE6|nr:hypothetical protein [Ligilactobacillus agilis]OXC07256.1 hypothetical protein AYP74_08670 [Ligilactobacillus agilis]OXC07556.1 hypothetical protein AYP76_07360 [Ligilactobacillus agilis]OXC11001.1 hypothetical protein AYP75_04865 [Ligilactobacillus agilis]OXS40525.1 hypothetical protein AYP70_04440 [Ligilactobacillus agilis]OXS47659.1 hypothetical protein AYP71_10620 [Ligilactobacillus agilis]